MSYGTIYDGGVAPYALDLSQDDRLNLVVGEELTSNRSLDVRVGDADRRLDVLGDSLINQDVQSTASPTFAGLTVGSGTGFGRFASGVLTPFPDGATFEYLRIGAGGSPEWVLIPTPLANAYSGLLVDAGTPLLQATGEETAQLSGGNGIQTTGSTGAFDQVTFDLHTLTSPWDAGAGSEIEVGSLKLKGTGATLELLTNVTSDATLTLTVTAPGQQLSVSGPSSINQDVTTSGSPTFADLTVTGTVDFAGMSLTQWSADAVGAELSMRKSRAASPTQTIVQDADELAEINFAGSDGTAFVKSFFIRGLVNGTPAAGIVPTDVVFEIMNTGGSINESFRILETGNVRFDTSRRLEFRQDDIHIRSRAADILTITGAPLGPGLIELVSDRVYVINPTDSQPRLVLNPSDSGGSPLIEFASNNGFVRPEEQSSGAGFAMTVGAGNTTDPGQDGGDLELTGGIAGAGGANGSVTLNGVGIPIKIDGVLVATIEALTGSFNIQAADEKDVFLTSGNPTSGSSVAAQLIMTAANQLISGGGFEFRVGDGDTVIGPGSYQFKGATGGGATADEFGSGFEVRLGDGTDTPGDFWVRTEEPAISTQVRINKNQFILNVPIVTEDDATAPNDININAGDATSGNNKGADIIFDPGDPSGTGADGLVKIGSGSSFTNLDVADSFGVAGKLEVNNQSYFDEAINMASLKRVNLGNTTAYIYGVAGVMIQQATTITMTASGGTVTVQGTSGTTLGIASSLTTIKASASGIRFDVVSSQWQMTQTAFEPWTDESEDIGTQSKYVQGVYGHVKPKVRTVTGTTTLTDEDDIVFIDISADATITLFAGPTGGTSHPLTLIRIDSSAAVATLDGNGSEQIQGEDTQTIDPGEAYHLEFDGSDWWLG